MLIHIKYTQRLQINFNLLRGFYMKKVVVIIFSFFLLLPLLCSCELEKNRVYVCDNDRISGYDSICTFRDYNKAEHTYTLPEAREWTEPLKKSTDRSLTLGDQTYSLNYKKTSRQALCEETFHVYQNEDQTVTARYMESTGDLWALRLYESSYKITDSPIQSETQLLEVCKEYLSSYVDSFDGYTVTVLTETSSSSGHQKRNGFFPLSDEGDSPEYTVQFRYDLHDIVTVDAFEISITQEGMLSSVILPIYSIRDRAAGLSLDLAKTNADISATVEKMCRCDGVTYAGYTDTKAILVLDGKLCLFASVKPEFTDSEFPAPIEILIPLE